MAPFSFTEHIVLDIYYDDWQAAKGSIALPFSYLFLCAGDEGITECNVHFVFQILNMLVENYLHALI